MNDDQIAKLVVVDETDLDQSEIARFLTQFETEIGLRRIPAAILTEMNGDIPSPADLHEVGAPVAIEVTGKLRELANAEVVEIEFEFAGEIEPCPQC